MKVWSNKGLKKAVSITKEGTTRYYGTIQSAIQAASEGDTILLGAGTYELSEQLTINKAITLEGIGTVTLKAVPDGSWSTVNGSKHLLAIHAGTESEPVTISNMVIDANNESHAINTYDNAYGILDNVTIENGLGAGLTVNGSTIEANNLNTSGNAWGAVNVDIGGNVSTSSVFTLTGNGELEEDTQIWSDGDNVTENETVTVNAPAEYILYEIEDTTLKVWSNKGLKKAVSITKEGTTKYYVSIQSAIDAAEAKDTILVGAGTYLLSEPLNINKAIMVQGVNKETVILKGANDIGNTVSLSNGATLKDVTVTRDNSIWVGNSNVSLVAFGQGLTAETTLENCIIKHGRNGVYLNNTANVVIKDNLIDNNRTGIQMANSASAIVENNTITNNHTMGVLLQWLSADNHGIPTFTGNTIEDNWYSDFENRWPTREPQYNVDLTDNTFTDSTYTIADSSGEPGYDDLQPVELGGDAVRPTERVTFVMKTDGNITFPSMTLISD